ncbi:MAG: Gfo/Idh/MocA family oxidoreductase [Alphaproteobacteria bacterium]|nr:Gfo/Idh/MocA family oxidoreductase [Alphaproteobacteria bacterium]
MENYNVAIVGCGYAADFYLSNMAKYPWLRVTAAFDRDHSRLTRFAAQHSLCTYETLDELLREESTLLILNLTGPDSHYAVSAAALSAGKHVYSEKPFATTMQDAAGLLRIAAENGVELASAPCSVLGRAAQTTWKLLREGAIGQPLLAFGDLSDGMIHMQSYHLWISASGAQWPAADEFRIGCLMEHGEYLISWLTTFFGRVYEVVGTTDILVPDKGTSVRCGPDMATGLLRFESGVIARLSFSSLTPHDRSLTLVGTTGVLRVADVWDMNSRVELRESLKVTVDRNQYLSLPREQVLVGVGPAALYQDSHNIDQVSGVAEMVEAIRLGREPRLSARRALHGLEVLLSINGAGHGRRVNTKTAFDGMEPMPWALHATGDYLD